MEKLKLGQRNNAEWALLVLIAGENSPEWIEEYKKKGGLEVTVLINGKEFAFTSLINRLMEDFHRQVNNKAIELFQEKAADLSNKLWEFSHDFDHFIENS